jgi:hypothetical protein
MQLQEDLKKHLSAECHYTEEQLEAYMQTHKSVMVDSLWKLNVADIEATLSHVCQMVLQDSSVRKEELRARAKGLKTLGKVFQVQFVIYVSMLFCVSCAVLFLGLSWALFCSVLSWLPRESQQQ